MCLRGYSVQQETVGASEWLCYRQSETENTCQGHSRGFPDNTTLMPFSGAVPLDRSTPVDTPALLCCVNPVDGFSNRVPNCPCINPCPVLYYHEAHLKFLKLDR